MVADAWQHLDAAAQAAGLAWGSPLRFVHTPPKPPAPSERYVTSRSPPQQQQQQPHRTALPTRLFEHPHGFPAHRPVTAVGSEGSALPLHLLSPIQQGRGGGGAFSPSQAAAVTPVPSPVLVRRALELGVSVPAPTPTPTRISRRGCPPLAAEEQQATESHPPPRAGSVPHCRPHASQGSSVVSPAHHCAGEGRGGGGGVPSPRAFVIRAGDDPGAAVAGSGTARQHGAGGAAEPGREASGSGGRGEGVGQRAGRQQQQPAAEGLRALDKEDLVSRVLRLEAVVSELQASGTEVHGRVRSLEGDAELRELRLGIHDEELRRLQAAEGCSALAAVVEGQQAEVSAAVRSTEERARRLAEEIDGMLHQDRQRRRHSGGSVPDVPLPLPETLPGWSRRPSDVSVPDGAGVVPCRSQSGSSGSPGSGGAVEGYAAAPHQYPEHPAVCAPPPARLVPGGSDAGSSQASCVSGVSRRSLRPTKSPAEMPSTALPMHDRAVPQTPSARPPGPLPFAADEQYPTGQTGQALPRLAYRGPAGHTQRRPDDLPVQQEVPASAHAVHVVHHHPGHGVPHRSHSRSAGERSGAGGPGARHEGVVGGGLSNPSSMTSAVAPGLLGGHPGGYCQASRGSSPHVYRSLTASSDASSIRAIASSRQMNYESACRALGTGDTEGARALLLKCAAEGQAMSDILRPQGFSDSVSSRGVSQS